jgi:hypothetical protein
MDNAVREELAEVLGNDFDPTAKFNTKCSNPEKVEKATVVCGTTQESGPSLTNDPSKEDVEMANVESKAKNLPQRTPNRASATEQTVLKQGELLVDQHVEGGIQSVSSSSKGSSSGKNVSFAAAVLGHNPHNMRTGTLQALPHRNPPLNPYLRSVSPQSNEDQGTRHIQCSTATPARVDKTIILKKNNLWQHIHRYTL